MAVNHLHPSITKTRPGYTSRDVYCMLERVSRQDELRFIDVDAAEASWLCNLIGKSTPSTLPPAQYALYKNLNQVVRESRQFVVNFVWLYAREAKWLMGLIQKEIPDVKCYTHANGDCAAMDCPLHTPPVTLQEQKMPTFRLRVCDGLYFDLTGHAPNRLHRWLTRLFFGWKFE